MDLGVGSFVFSQGLVSALPIVKDINYLKHPVWIKVKESLKRSAPLLFLGLVRLILVKGTDYPVRSLNKGAWLHTKAVTRSMRVNMERIGTSF